MRRAAITLAALLTCLLVAQASAAEISRDEYVERVEPICKTNTEANERILAGVRKKVKEGKLAPAARQFLKAAAALKQTRLQLLAVPMPSADKTKLTKWLDGVKGEITLLETIGRKLKAGDQIAAQKASVKLIYNANKVNAEVVNFEFTYCRFEPSRYT